MFSKASKIRLMLTVFFSIGLLACSDFLNEKKDNRQALELEGGNFICLQKLPEQMSLYVEGTIPSEEVRNAIDCGREALLYFNKNTTGTYPQAYAPADLQRFFGKYFLKENNLSSELLAELFKLKKMILGGSANTLTKTEIQTLTEVLSELKEPMVLLAPEMPRLLTKAPSANLESIDRSVRILTDVLLKIVDQAEVLTSKYTFQDFKALLAETEKFINDRKPSKMFQLVKTYTPLLESLKGIFIGETARFQGLSDWQRAAQTTAGLYAEYLRFHYLVKGKATGSEQSLKAITVLIDQGFELVAESLPMKQQGRIAFKELDKLVSGLAEAKLLSGISSTSIKNLYKVVISRALDTQRQGDLRGFDSLERAHFLALHHEWRIFKLHQAVIEKFPFDEDKSVSFTEMKEFSEKERFVRQQIEALSPESFEQGRLHEAWLNGKNFLLQEFPAMYDSKGRAIVARQPHSYRQSFASLTRWNIVRALSRLMMIGYGSEKSIPLPERKIFVKSLEAWYSDFRHVGIELKAFDPRSGNSGSRSFKEANFFTFKGDGNEEMNYQETFDFVSLLVSGGMVSSEGIRQGMLKAGCQMESLDVFNYPFFSEPCFEKNFRSLVPQLFSNLPGLVDQVQQMTDDQWQGFYDNLMTVSRSSNEVDGVVETSDIRSAVMMLHYTESLMVVYDANGNSFLDVHELRAAAPRFSNFMTMASPKFVQKVRQLFPKTGESLVEDFFLYLVYRGHKPELPLVDYLGRFQFQKEQDSLGEVSRDKILRVFKVLKDEAAKQ